MRHCPSVSRVFSAHDLHEHLLVSTVHTMQSIIPWIKRRIENADELREPIAFVSEREIMRWAWPQRGCAFFYLEIIKINTHIQHTCWHYANTSTSTKYLILFHCWKKFNVQAQKKKHWKMTENSNYLLVVDAARKKRGQFKKY